MRAPVTRLVVLTVVLGSCGVLLAQAPRVVVTRTGDDELKRTAYRLRLCPEQLRDARQALAAAQELAPDLADQVWLGDLGHLINRIDREHAPEILTQLLGQMADLAGKTEDSRSYQALTNSAQLLLWPLRETDPGAAEEMVRNWPEPHVDGPEKSFLQQLRMSMANEQFNSLGRSDPVQAMQRLPEFEGGKVNLQTRNNLLQQLVSVGADKEAHQLLDESVAATLETGLDPGSIYSFGQLFSTTAHSLPDRLPNMMSQLETVLPRLSNAAGGEWHVSGKTISVSEQETLVLSIAQSLGNRPDTVNRVLNLVPSLRQKLEPFGGIDGFLSPPPPPRTVTSTRRVISESRSGQVSEASIAELEAGNPSPQDVVDLTQAARSLCERDARRGVGLLERAGEILAKKADLQTAETFHFVITSCLECQGGLSPKIVELGNELLDRFRREQNKAPVASPDPQMNQPEPRFFRESADRLEALLIAAQAVEDFGRAMDLAGALADAKVRYSAYIQIAQQIAR